MNNFFAVFGAFFLIVLLWVVFGIIFTVNAEFIAVPATLFVITSLCFYFFKTNQDKKIAKFILVVFWLNVLILLAVSALCGYVWLLGSNWTN